MRFLTITISPLHQRCIHYPLSIPDRMSGTPSLSPSGLAVALHLSVQTITSEDSGAALVPTTTISTGLPENAHFSHTDAPFR